MQLKKDAQVFLSVMESNKGIIYKVANAYCKNDENRKDLIQEILVQLWLSFGKYDKQYSISTWMYRIALNVAISFYRKENSRNKINQPLPVDTLFLREEGNGLQKEADLQHLQQFIKELKEIDRAIIILYLEEKPQQEIATILGLSTTNIATRVLRIKQQLKQKFSTIKN